MNVMELDGVNFRLDTRPGPQRGKSEDDSFVLVKNASTISFYEGMRPKSPKNILELGMFEGGSLVYFDKLFKPARLVGIDIRKAPIAALEKYKEDRPYIKTFYGISQDKPRARGVAQSNFPDGIDLVVDDASHLYAQTKASFELIFPLVKPGGMYIIEDWAWSHRKNYQTPGATWYAQPALSNLIFNLVVLTAASRVIDNLTVTDSFVCVTKGRGKLPESQLDVSGFLRGREMALI